jgi:hypothetical protein
MTASPRLDEGKGAMGMVEKGMTKMAFQQSANPLAPVADADAQLYHYAFGWFTIRAGTPR